MAITGTLTIIDTDFSDALNGIVAACSINVLRVTAILSGGTDAGAYCELYAKTYKFRLINKSFDGTSGEFYFDFTDILPAFFTDVSDINLESGVSLNELWLGFTAFTLTLYDSLDNELDIIDLEFEPLFSSKQIGNPNGTNELDWVAGQPFNFLAQKNKQSYIYYYGAGTCSFEKVGNVPKIYAMIDNNDAVMVDNNGDAIINEY